MYDNNVIPKEINYKLEPLPDSSVCVSYRHKELQEIHWKWALSVTFVDTPIKLMKRE